MAEAPVTTVAGVVLAAGGSRRMGKSKSHLRYRSQTFLDLLSTALVAGGCRPVLTVVAEPVAAAKGKSKLTAIELVVNPDPGRGQISSLRCALRAVPEAEGIVVLLVDQGEVLARTVRAVREALTQAPVAVARYRGQPGHPTGFSREVFEELESPRADSGARLVVEAYRLSGHLRWVDADDPGVTRNINTPAQYAAFLGERLVSPP